MRAFSVSLKEEYGTQGGMLDCYLCDDPMDNRTTPWKRPAVVVVPGGGCRFCSKREEEPVASAF